MIDQTDTGEFPGENDPIPDVDTDAERCLCGAVLLTNDALLDVAGAVSAADFHDKRLGDVWATMLVMSERGAAIDVITLHAALKEAGCSRAADFALLSSLDASVPATANALRYADIVHDRSLRRQLKQVAADIGQSASIDFRPTAELVSDAEARVFALRGDGADEAPLVSVGRGMAAHFRRYERAYEAHQKGEIAAGVATGFPDIDAKIAGLRSGDLFILGGRPGSGKAQPLSEPVLTPGGFVPMGSLKVGDLVIGSAGSPVRVTGVFPRGVLPVFRVGMSDGTSTRCSEDHLWWTRTRNERRTGIQGSVKSLKEIRATIHRQDGAARNHAVPIVAPVDFVPRGPLPLHPWLMGALLGDGCFRRCSVVFTKPEPDVEAKVMALLPEGDEGWRSPDGIRIRRKVRSNSPSDTVAILRSMGLMGCLSSEKFIPEAYLFADVDSRRLLLHGLIDTDGSVGAPGQVEFSSSSPRMAKEVEFLVRSLGGRCTASSRIPKYTYKGAKMEGKRSVRMLISMPDGSLPAESEKHRSRWAPTSRRFHRSIVSIEPDGSEECQCIAVDAPDCLYVTRDFILTHNTSWALQVADTVATTGAPVAVFSLEMQESALVDRLVAISGRVDGTQIRTGAFYDSDWPKMARAAEHISKLPLFIRDRPGQSVLDMRATARRIRAKHGDLALIVIDYTQLVRPANERDSRERQIASIAEGFKYLAKEANCAVLALSSLNRPKDGDESKAPTMASLKESGALEFTADCVAFIHRERGSAEATFSIAKQRSGGVGDVRLSFAGGWTRFDTATAPRRDHHGGD